MSTLLTVEEASRLSIDPSLRKLLTPQEVARFAVLPLAQGADQNSLVVAADPEAPENVEKLLRMRLGVRRVELRPTTRRVMESILEAHFVPYWSQKGWQFPGFPPSVTMSPSPAKGPEGSAPETHRAAAAPPSAAAHSLPAAPASAASPAPHAPSAAAARPETDHPVILVVDALETRRKALGELLLEAGYEPRSAATLEAVERELHRAPPSIVLARSDGPVPLDALVALVRGSRGGIELRVVRDYAGALLGSAGDERMPSFLFDLVRFFAGIVSVAAGAAVYRSEARARTAESAARHMGLAPAVVEAARLAALFGDLEGNLRRLRTSAGGEQREDSAPGGLEQLLDPARTPFPIRAALEERKERFDGKGPRRLAGEAISPAGRVLAAVDAFFLLKEGGATGAELEGRFRAEAGKGLDPRAAEAVLRSERAGQIVDRLGTEEERVLVVDPDPVAASLLEMRLANSGIGVEIHRDGESALAAAVRDRPDLIISEVAMPGLDGFSLLLRLRKGESTKEIPFMFLSERTDRGSSVRGFDLGADDFISKPADLELLAAKIKGLVRKARARRPSTRESGGVSGSLAEMGIVDLLQVLASSHKTVRVRVEDGRGLAGELSIVKGKLVDASTGELSGQEAFFALACWTEGRFTVKADEQSGKATIEAPIEMLLLEACRRRDEASRLA